MNYTRLNIALVPPKEISTYARDISLDIAKEYDTHFVLGDGVFAHITLYSGMFPDDGRCSFFRAVGEFSATQKTPQNLKYKSIDSDRGSIVTSFCLSKQIYKLHKDLVGCLNPYRRGAVREKYQSPEYQNVATKEQLSNIDKYGYPYVFGLFNPHMTLTRLMDWSVAGKLVQNVVWDKVSFDCDEVGVFEMGENGTCKKLLKKYVIG